MGKGPFQYEHSRPAWQGAADRFQRADIDDRRVVAILGMEVGRTVLSPEHADDHAVEPADGRHVAMMHPPTRNQSSLHRGPDRKNARTHRPASNVHLHSSGGDGLPVVHFESRDGGPQGQSGHREGVELDPENADALAVSGFCRCFFDWDFDLAAEQMRRAVALNPGSSTTHYNLTILLANLGDAEGAVAHGMRAVELDPLWSGSHQALQWALMTAHRDREVLERARMALDLAPGRWTPRDQQPLPLAQHSRERSDRRYCAHPKHERPFHEVAEALFHHRLDAGKSQLHFVAQLRHVGSVRISLLHPSHKILRRFLAKRLQEFALQTW